MDSMLTQLRVITDAAFLVLFITILASLVFDFINGFHDTANAIATTVATGVFPDTRLCSGNKIAVIYAALWNLSGALFGTAVAATVGKGIIDAGAIHQETIIAALMAAITWNLFTWRLGLPSSSSHALIFSLLGAGIATAGMGVVVTEGVKQILLWLVLSPILGFAGGYALIRLFLVLARRSHAPAYHVDRFARVAQLATSGFMAFSHGGNDAQKTMGVITLALAQYYSTAFQNGEFAIPLWVIVISSVTMAAGTSVGGWKIIRTMGERITQLKPIQGCAAELAAATIIETITRWLGVPISTTHVISTSIIGSGQGMGTICRMTVGKIGTAWVFTIPSCFLLAYLFVTVYHFFYSLR